MADVSSRQLRELLFEPARCQFNGKLMRILQHSQVLVSLFFDSSCIDMRIPARSAVHYSRPLCPKHLDTSPSDSPQKFGRTKILQLPILVTQFLKSG